MKRCLVVDDSRVIRRVAAKIVEDLGFISEEAENGMKALRMCAQSMPQVVLLDWEMPVLDGISCARELRTLPGGKDIAIIFCTTRNRREDIVAALDAGADEYVMKPFDSEILRAKFLVLGLAT